jgi:hypothetical protein
MAGWRQAIELAIGEEDLASLSAIARSRTEPASRVERARMLLAYRKTPSFFAVGQTVGVHHQTVQRCVERALAYGPTFCTDTRPVLGTSDSKAARAPGRPTEQGTPRQPGFATAPFLPKDLAGALKRRNRCSACGCHRRGGSRGWLPPSRTKEKPTAHGRPQPRQAPTEHGTSSLTTGKLNAVRAAFKAGVKPSAIARQFGISQSDVSKALATESRDRKSGR